ncbi:carbohydrate esterase family 16 [Fusarium heterosporum]|uniref:Carbohydrate esterase family 16 n=1 Tax=Fusarium heterosporum TaxID=42747 RepID=A0A8H5WQV2_FUSHE|nr:carbohydrate esterase family 16 [Fusarium heterosporum]
MSKEKMSNRMLTTTVFVVSTILILTLLAYHRTSDFRAIIPITIQDDVQEPTERFIIAFGDSYSRAGFKMNTSYIRTGPRMHDMKKFQRPERKLVGSPRAENPIGNPEFPGITSSGGKNWAMYMATEFNTTLTLAYIFARSASVVDAEVIPPRRNTTFTFAHQIAQFNETIGHRPDYAAWTAKNAVVTIWFGLNDLSIALGKEGQDKNLRATIRRMFELTEILYKMGLRNFVFIEMPPFIQPESLGALNSTCVDPEGKTCLWADAHHPGRRIHQLIGARVAGNAWGNED